ncbi:unnamed protein product [Notodromas monacha]|uniref:Uncharacterized protein n=1 Tax=Notodromas monacha TaxID=399045 RepID=A0A7R9BIZ6_9CRUS|nr:unnamed protein product [Notodromas monacha]CAG0914975.1 unnamed protein product [Notodromas monacha]
MCPVTSLVAATLAVDLRPGDVVSTGLRSYCSADGGKKLSAVVLKSCLSDGGLQLARPPSLLFVRKDIKPESSFKPAAATAALPLSRNCLARGMMLRSAR